MTAIRDHLRKGLAVLLSGAMVVAFAPGAGVVAQQLGEASTAWAEDAPAEQPVALVDESVSLAADSLAYTGSALTPAVTVKVTDAGTEKTLAVNTDYTVVYERNTNVGTAKVTVTGTGDYTGTVTKTFAITPADITGATATIANQVYTGSPIVPPATAVTLTVNGVRLDPSDYTVSQGSLANDKITDIGEQCGPVVITGKGNYKGSTTAHFSILRADITKATVTCTLEDGTKDILDTKVPYTGRPYKVVPTVTLNGKTLDSTGNKDYEFTCTDNQEIGFAKVVITGRGNYQGTVTRRFEIAASTITDGMIDVELPKDAVYNGTAYAPQVTVKQTGTAGSEDVVLEQNKDYTVTYSNNVNAGTASIIVAGKGFFSGSVTKTFEIKPIEIEESDVTLSSQAFVYNGTEKKPDVTISKTVSDKRFDLKATDFDVKYENNVNVTSTAQPAKAIVTCKGNFKNKDGQSITKTFEIQHAKLTDDMVELSTTEFAYETGKVTYTPEVTVTIDGKKCQPADYSLTFRDNTCVDEPSSPVDATVEVRITNTSLNYADAVVKHFTIRNATPLNKSDYTVVLGKDSYVYDGTAKEPILEVRKKDGTKLKEGTDYKVEYLNNVNAGTAHVKVTGQGAYADSIDVPYTIEKLPLSDSSLNVTVKVMTYTGSPIEPSVTLRITVGKVTTTLVKDKDYKIVYSNNVLAGTNTAKATVTAEPNCNFTGTREIPFTINPITLKANNTTVVLDNYEYAADGKAKEPVVRSVTYKTTNTLLVKDKDFTVTYSNNIDNGTAKVNIVGKGNYTQTVSVDFTIKESLGVATAADRVEANKVVSKIKAIGKITSLTEKNKTNVTNARDAYTALTALQKTVVTNYEDLLTAETTIKNLEAAKVTQDLIAGLGKTKDLKLENKTQVEEARASYESLTADQQAYVTEKQLKALKDAEDQIAKLQKQEDQQNAKSVSDLIGGLGTVSSLADKAKVEEARAAYNALNADEKPYVTNLSALVDAEAAIANLTAAQTVIDTINALGPVSSLEDADAVAQVRAAYDSLTAAQQLLVTNVSTLRKAEGMITKLTVEAAQPARGANVASGSGASAGFYKVATVAKIANTGKTSTAGTLTYQKVPSKKTKKVTVPDTAKIAGATYKVTGIAANAFKGSAATSVTVGKNVTSIGAKSLAGASKLKSLTLGAGVKKVAAKAFKSNKKLATITVKSKKLTKKSVKNALKGSKVKTIVVKVGSKAQNKKYVKKYKKLFTKKVAGKSVKVK